MDDGTVEIDNGATKVEVASKPQLDETTQKRITLKPIPSQWNSTF